MFGGIITQSLLDIGSVLCTFEVHAAEAEGAVEEMNVAIDEPGKDQMAACFNHLRCGRAEFEDCLFISDRDDFSIADGQRLRPGLRAVARIDFAGSDDGVSGGYRSRCERCCK